MSAKTKSFIPAHIRRLAQQRRTVGLSQLQLARLASVRYQRITRGERGYIELTSEEIAKITAAIAAHVRQLRKALCA